MIAICVCLGVNDHFSFLPPSSRSVGHNLTLSISPPRYEILTCKVNFMCQQKKTYYGLFLEIEIHQRASNKTILGLMLLSHVFTTSDGGRSDRYRDAKC